jgi:hypothetical protein
MSALDSSQCPEWCAGHSLHMEFDNSKQVTHKRPVVASDALSADLEWYEDLRQPSDPEYFQEPAMLVINEREVGTEIVVPISHETLDLLARAVEAARLTLVTANSGHP